MALTPEQQKQVDQLKKYLGSALQTPPQYTDDELYDQILAAGGDLYEVASNVWAEEAARTASMVDMAEGSSRRALGDLFEQAQKMSLYYKNMETESEAALGGTTTSPIRRS